MKLSQFIAQMQKLHVPGQDPEMEISHFRYWMRFKEPREDENGDYTPAYHLQFDTQSAFASLERYGQVWSPEINAVLWGLDGVNDDLINGRSRECLYEQLDNLDKTVAALRAYVVSHCDKDDARRASYASTK